MITEQYRLYDCCNALLNKSSQIPSIVSTCHVIVELNELTVLNKFLFPKIPIQEVL